MGGKSGGSVDAVGAAREQGRQAQILNSQQTAANRPDQYNPWGSTRWENQVMEDPVTGQPVNRWVQTETLADPLHASLQSQMNIGQGRAALAEGAMARAWEDYQNPFDFSQFGDIQQFDYDPNDMRMRAEDAAYQRSTNRLDPQFQAQEQALLTRLNNQGLRPGDQAYDSAMQNFQMGRNDAYEQARLGATGEGRTESNLMFNQALQQNQIANALRQQGISEGLGQRGFNLSEAERLLQGQLISGGPPSSGGATQTAVQPASGGLASLLTGGS